MMKWHNKFPHHSPGVVYFGERGEIPLRINKAQSDSEEMIFQEPLHYHKESSQFFLLVRGSLLVEVDGQALEITPDRLLEIEPGTIYRVLKAAPNSEWVVIGTVNSEGDRVEIK